MSGAYEQATDFEMDGDIEMSRRARRARLASPFVLGVAALTLFFVTQILQLVPALAGFQIAKLIVVAVSLIFLSSRERIASRIRIRAVPQLRYMLGILVFAAATVPFAFWSAESFRFITEMYIKNIVFVYLLVQAARSDLDTRAIAGALVAGCSMIVLAMLVGFGPLVNYQADDRQSVGETYDPNDLALLFVITIPYAFFMLKSSRTFTRVLLIAAMGLMLIGMVKGGSRGGFLGLLVIAALILMRSSKQARKYALVSVIIGASLFAFAAPPAFWDRVSRIYNYEEDYNLKEQDGRLTIWKNGLEMIVSRPLTGVGIACFQYAYPKYSETKLQRSPHNSFLQVAAELGPVGLSLFLAIIIVSVRTAWRIRRRKHESAAEEELGWLASAVEVSFAGFFVSGFFLTHAYSAIFCFLAGMAAVLLVRNNIVEEQSAIPVEEIEYA